jgi:RNA polymerase sigma-70 factor, ECF subfamily
MNRLSNEVVGRFVAGEIDALRIIYDETKDYTYRIIYRMVNNTMDAEDLMHDAYEKVYKNREKYDMRKAGIKTWVSKVAINHTLNYLKKKKTSQNYLHLFQKGVNEGDHIDETVTDEDDIHRVLMKVKPDYRICLVLKYVEDHSYQEISDLLKINIGTVRSRISRGKSMFKTLYAQVGS